MLKRVLITIIGQQRVGNEDDQIELTTVGELEHTEDGYILRYKEELEPPFAALDTTLRIFNDEKRVEMIKAGPYNSCLIIEKSKRNLCHYGTAYGDMLMGIYGRFIEIQCGETSGNFIFEYDIDINGALTSKNKVTVNYQINQEN